MVDMYEVEEFYKDLGYAPKKMGWKFGALFFVGVILPFIFLIGLSCLWSIPRFIKGQLRN